VCRFLAAGNPNAGTRPLEYLVSVMTLKQGRLTARRVVKALAPAGLDPSKGADLRLVRQRRKGVFCDQPGCQAKFAEKKELFRHKRSAHVAGPGQQLPHGCPVLNCSRSFKTRGWLYAHMRAVHAGS
jgi:hypothetical protein